MLSPRQMPFDWTNALAERGQALNHAVTDAAELVRAIEISIMEGSTVTRAEAIETYERTMMTRAGEEVRLCDANTRQLHNWAEAGESPVMKNGLSNEKKENGSG